MAEGMGGEVGISGRCRDPGDSRLPIVTVLGETFVPESSSAGVMMETAFGGDGITVIETQGTLIGVEGLEVIEVSSRLETKGVDMAASDWSPTVFVA